MSCIVPWRKKPIHLTMESTVTGRRYHGPNPRTGRYTLSAHNQDIVFSVPLVGSVLGGLAASPLNFRLDRKWPVLMAHAISICGDLLQVFATSLAAFMAGRFINSIARVIRQWHRSPISFRGGSCLHERYKCDINRHFEPDGGSDRKSCDGYN
ncbi:uncharacterized protein BDW43DRAFT_184413 [Aspergillus alliaceus]|uniref:uncharacterized protein n=1 Tax=Petromyces alliaceus TaxID=209559 RepID=UPI0012A4B61F|nr:uncharacterized protein BDW43DRAFT_184413 [Aspergillus alliaceus]KAB8237826.1 hypothetical protein BDW43DRAFT_184413 [Aspergillus alliaceus]